MMLTAGDIAVCMRLPPEKIIEYLAKKEVFISWDWHDLWQEEHAGAKTIAKVTRLDILQDIYNALEKAAAEGKTGRWFRKELEPVLQAKGWWGRITEVNPDTGEEQEIQAGSPWRLDTIFR
ncbi:phage head morphogenesis protein, partial [Salmonella enterica]